MKKWATFEKCEKRAKFVYNYVVAEMLKNIGKLRSQLTTLVLLKQVKNCE